MRFGADEPSWLEVFDGVIRTSRRAAGAASAKCRRSGATRAKVPDWSMAPGFVSTFVEASTIPEGRVRGPARVAQPDGRAANSGGHGSRRAILRGAALGDDGRVAVGMRPNPDRQDGSPIGHFLTATWRPPCCDTLCCLRSRRLRIELRSQRRRPPSRSYRGRSDLIRDYEWGTNVSPEGMAQGFTHCFLLTFASAADRDASIGPPGASGVCGQSAACAGEGAGDRLLGARLLRNAHVGVRTPAGDEIA